MLSSIELQKGKQTSARRRLRLCGCHIFVKIEQLEGKSLHIWRDLKNITLHHSGLLFFSYFRYVFLEIQTNKEIIVVVSCNSGEQLGFPPTFTNSQAEAQAMLLPKVC